MQSASSSRSRITHYVSRRRSGFPHVSVQRPDNHKGALIMFARQLLSALRRFEERHTERRSFGQVLMDQFQRRRRVYW